MPSNMQPIAGYHSGEFLRLGRLLQLQTHFSIVFAAVDNPQYRSDLIRRFSSIDHAETAFTVVNVVEQIDIQTADEPLVVIKHCEAAQEKGATRLHLCFELDQSMTAQWWQQVNILRERIADAFPHTLVLWMSDSQITLAAKQAPDLWNWRNAVFSFVSQHNQEPFMPVLTSPTFNAIIHFEEESAKVRLNDLKDYLEQNNSAMSAYVLLEMADIEDRLGDLTSALNHANHAIKIFEESDNTRVIAVAKGKLASIFTKIGRLDEALVIQQNEVLPIFTQLGDARSIAVTKSRIADIYQIRGKLDEALEIRQNEILPLLNILNDTRLIAVTNGQIADIFQARGKLYEALTVRQNDELPIYQQLGDVRSVAITKGKIAEIFRRHGRLDEALAIRLQEELPILEQLGDVHAAAISKGKIADIYHDRGRLEEALSLRQNEELPIFEQLGDVRSAAVTKGKIADILYALGRLDEALSIRQNEELPVYEKLQAAREIAIVKTKIADIYFDQNLIDEALTIWTCDALPFFKALGYVNELKAVEDRIKNAIDKQSKQKITN